MSSIQPINTDTTALLLIDMQNDFLHPKGAYGRASQTSAAIAGLKQKIAPVAHAMRRAGGLVISTQFTLVPGKHGEPIISPHLKALRPFLCKGDFCPGAFGHQLIDELQPADVTIEKITYSAFYMTRLEWVLRKLAIRHLVIAGIVTNGGVASTLRDAHVRDFDTTVLSDGCGAFSSELHDNAIRSLAAISAVSDCSAMVSALNNLKSDIRNKPTQDRHQKANTHE